MGIMVYSLLWAMQTAGFIASAVLLFMMLLLLVPKSLFQVTKAPWSLARLEGLGCKVPRIRFRF